MMDVTALVIGVGCFGIWVGSLIERIVSFTQVRRQMSNVIDRMDGQLGT